MQRQTICIINIGIAQTIFWLGVASMFPSPIQFCSSFDPIGKSPEWFATCNELLKSAGFVFSFDVPSLHGLVFTSHLGMERAISIRRPWRSLSEATW